MFKSASELAVGDVIVEGRSQTTVEHFDSLSCKNKIHINKKDCYEPFAEVRVLDGGPSDRTQEIDELRKAVDDILDGAPHTTVTRSF